MVVCPRQVSINLPLPPLPRSSIVSSSVPDIRQYNSCILLFLSIDNTEFGKGPKSKHARERDGIIGADPESACADPEEKERFAPEASPYAQQIPSQTVSAAAAVAANDNAAAAGADGAAHAPLTSLGEEGRPAAV